MSRPAVFVDRDGTMLTECGYLERLADLRLFPWTGDAVRLLNRAGFAVVVITNQSGVARGMFDEAFVHETHREIDRRIAPARVDGYFYCPHLPEARREEYRMACDCRKPRPGLLVEAAGRHGIDLGSSFMVGDRWKDVEAGRRAGCTTLLIDHGYAEAGPPSGPPDRTVRTLSEAAAWILVQNGGTT